MNDALSFKPVMRQTDPRDLEPFFSPHGVAVIGASPKRGNLGRRIVDSLRAHGYAGTVTTVHPQGMEVPSARAVRSVDELPAETDLAIAAVPAGNVHGLLSPLARRGIRHLIVVSGGFAEGGESGRQRQEALRAEAARWGIRLLGPNCMGTFSAPDRFNSFFLSSKDVILPKDGSVAVISQSGALLSLFLTHMAETGIGVRRAVNFGNRADVDECELLAAFAADPAVQVIAVYLESVKDGKKFVETAHEVTRTKPVVIWKGGHGERGGDAAFSHSASLAQPYTVFRAACAKAGLIEVAGFREFSGAARMLASQPRARGNRALIVSNGGGMCVFLADLCEKAGLAIPAPSAAVRARLAEKLPPYFSLQNPIDLTGSGTNEQCVLAINQVFKTGEFDCLLMVLLAGAEGITPEIAGMLKSGLPGGVPVALGAYGSDMLAGMRRAFAETGVPVFADAEEAAYALACIAPRTPPAVDVMCPPALAVNAFPPAWDGRLDRAPHEMEIKRLLTLCGVTVPASAHLQSPADVEAAAVSPGFPLILKAADAAIGHKTEAGGVVLDIADSSALWAKWREMSQTWPGRVWAERQLPPGLDLLVGAWRDPQFGSVLLFGSGGRYVEIYEDVERLLLPAEPRELAAMIDNTRAGRVIRGARTGRPLDRRRLLAFLTLVAEWMAREPKIATLDFNPVRLYENGLVVLDAKMTLMEQV